MVFLGSKKNYHKKKDLYSERMYAREIMHESLNRLNSYMQKEKNILNEGKENEATHWESLLGDSTSPIVTLTDAIHKSSKLKTINPNFSAVILSWLDELEIDSTSKVAVSFTGSFPGANLAVLSALESRSVDLA